MMSDTEKMLRGIVENARRGRGKSAKSLQLIKLSKEILEEIKPANVRAVCYRLFVGGATPDMSKNVTDRISTLLVWAREKEIIPWNWIVDETREAERIASWDDPASLIRAAVSQYRKDYWAMQPKRVEVWSEKGTIRGTLAPVLDEFGVTFRVMHGYGSATTLHSIAEEDIEHDKPLTVLYAGDHDPSGRHMSEIDLPSRLTRYGGDINIVRVALTESDVGEFSTLPSFPAESKSKDARYRWFTERYGDRCWELDALSPVILRQRMRDNIIGLLDIGIWNHVIKIERAERESMSTILTDWQSSISRQARKYSDDLGDIE